jgi:hypothetical protein
MATWMMFTVPCPTPSGETADQLLQKRIDGITPEMQASATELGCTFHRAWVTSDRSAFVAVACWTTSEGGRTFYERWQIQSEEGETATILEGDVGLVPLG